MSEEWRPVKGFPYEVSSLGRVRRRETGRLIAQTPVPKRNGQYLKVDLWKGCHRTTRTVHRLVAEAFHGRARSALAIEVNHVDCNPFNNRWTNLEWCTRQENEAHKRFFTAAGVSA